MCWSFVASAFFAAFGMIAVVYGAYKNRPMEILTVICYYSIMEILQSITYTVIDECESKMNQILTIVSYMHILFQPFVINTVALHFIPERISKMIRMPVYLLCAMSLTAGILSLYPFDWSNKKLSENSFTNIFCGPKLCSEFGRWHLIWNLPLNEEIFPGQDFFIFFCYFLLPITYGSYRLWGFFIITTIVPILITENGKEFIAVWCLSSVIITVCLLNRRIYSTFYVKNYFLWPKRARC
jgi:hypothetical protein